MVSITEEMHRLQKISESSTYSAGVMQFAIEYCAKIFSRHFNPGSFLELGPAEGVMTEFLNNAATQLTVVEGSKLFCDAIQERYPTVEVKNCLFEEFSSSRCYDNIVLSHVLEHVEDPGSLLVSLRNMLTDDGKIFASVPNARSLHRQAAVLMGLLSCENELNDSDIKHGHRVVFDPEKFRALFVKAGFKIDIFGGYWLKPLSNSQIEGSWTGEMLQSFMALGERYPDISGELYIVASAN